MWGSRIGEATDAIVQSVVTAFQSVKTTAQNANALLTEVKVVSPVASKISDELEHTMLEWKPHVDSITKMIQQGSAKYEVIREVTPEDSNSPDDPWMVFFLELKKITEIANKLSKKFSNRNSRNTSDIIKQASLFLQEFLSFICAFNRLDLHLMIGIVPTSINDFQIKISNLLYTFIKTSIPDYAIDGLELLQSRILDPVAFKQCEQFKKDIVLVSANHINDTFRNVQVFLDNLEINFAIKPGELEKLKQPFKVSYTLYLIEAPCQGKNIQEEKNFITWVLKGFYINTVKFLNDEVKTEIDNNKSDKQHEKHKNTYVFIKEINKLFYISDDEAIEAKIDDIEKFNQLLTEYMNKKNSNNYCSLSYEEANDLIKSNGGHIPKEHIFIRNESIQSLQDLNKKFCEIYQNLYENAGYSTDTLEMYPYSLSIEENRKTMLEKITELLTTERNALNEQYKKVCNENDEQIQHLIKQLKVDFSNKSNPDNSKKIEILEQLQKDLLALSLGGALNGGYTLSKDQEQEISFQERINERIKLIEEVLKKWWEISSNECDLILMSSLPTKDILGTLSIQSNLVYIRSGNQLFYVNKVNKECIEIINFNEETCKKFDSKINPDSKTAKSLSKKELNKITSMTDHSASDDVVLKEISTNYKEYRKSAISMENRRANLKARIRSIENRLPGITSKDNNNSAVLTDSSTSSKAETGNSTENGKGFDIHEWTTYIISHIKHTQNILGEVFGHTGEEDVESWFFDKIESQLITCEGKVSEILDEKAQEHLQNCFTRAKKSVSTFKNLQKQLKSPPTPPSTPEVNLRKTLSISNQGMADVGELIKSIKQLQDDPVIGQLVTMFGLNNIFSFQHHQSQKNLATRCIDFIGKETYDSFLEKFNKFKNRCINPAQFHELSLTEKDIWLLTGGLVNQLFKKLFLSLDTLEIRLFIKKHYLISISLFDSYSLKDLYNEFFVTYRNMMEWAGYDFEKVEVYPFVSAMPALPGVETDLDKLIQQGKRLWLKFTKHKADNRSAYNIKHMLNSINNILTRYEGEVSEMLDENIQENWQQCFARAKHSIAILEELQTQLESPPKRESTPEANLQKTLLLADANVDAVNSLKESIEQLQDDPLLGQLTAMFGLNNIFSSQHHQPEEDFKKKCVDFLLKQIGKEKFNTLLKKYNEFKIKWTDLDKFLSLPPIEQHMLLFTAGLMNQSFKKLFLLLDSLEIKFFIKKHYLISIPLFDSYSLKDFYNEFYVTYRNMMEWAGYDFEKVEVYPFVSAMPVLPGVETDLDKLIQDCENLYSSFIRNENQENNVPYDFKEWNDLIEQCNKIAEDNFDKKIYARCFGDQAFDVNLPGSLPLHFANSLRSLRKLVNDLKILQSQCYGKNAHTIVVKAQSPEEYIHQIWHLSGEVYRQGENFKHSILQQIALIKPFASIANIKQFLQQAMTQSSEVLNQETRQDPLCGFIYDECQKQANSLPDRLPSMRAALEKLSGLLGQMSHHDEVAEIARLEVKEFFNLLTAWQEKNSDKLHLISSIELINFCLNRFERIWWVIKCFSQAQSTLWSAAGSALLKFAQILNLVFRDIYLLLDKIEINLFLKEGMLKNLGIYNGVSFEKIVKSFHRLFSDYSFTSDEAYPYFNSMIAQRQEILENAKKEQYPSLFINFLAGKVVLLSLQKNQSGVMSMALPPNSESELNIALTKFKNDILLQIDGKLNQLKDQRTQKYCFFANVRKIQDEDHIQALIALKKILKQPGYTLNDAISEVYAYQSGRYHNILLRQEQKLLHRIQAIDNMISPSMRGKKRIDFIHPPEPVLAPSKYYIELINKRIAKLKKEIEISWMTNTKEIKIQLLQALRVHLCSNKSLDEALNEIKNHPKLGKHFYLLLEGRTGQVIQNIQHANPDPKDIIYRINIEIDRLERQQLGKSRFFFADRHAKMLKLRIQALLKLKEHMEGGQSFHDALETLSNNQRDMREILNLHELALIRDLEVRDDILRENVASI